MSSRTPRRAAFLGPALAALVLAGCGSGTSGGSAAAISTAPAGDTAADQSAQYASNTPPPQARLVCDEDEVRDAVADGLGVGSLPPPTSTWADHVYTCTYALPSGRLVLAVTVTPSTADARSRLSAVRTQLGASTQEPGLGQQGWSAPSGMVVAVKDNMVLTVDPTALPDDLGATHEHRLDYARVMAAVVFSCWTGST